MLLFMQLNQITAVISWNINGFGSFSSQKPELYFPQVLIHCGQERQFIFFIPSNLKQTHQKAGLGKLLMKKKQDLKLSQSA